MLDKVKGQNCWGSYSALQKGENRGKRHLTDKTFNSSKHSKGRVRVQSHKHSLFASPEGILDTSVHFNSYCKNCMFISILEHSGVSKLKVQYSLYTHYYNSWERSQYSQVPFLFFWPLTRYYDTSTTRKQAGNRVKVKRVVHRNTRTRPGPIVWHWCPYLKQLPLHPHSAKSTAGREDRPLNS